MSFMTFTLKETFCQHNMKIVRLKKNIQRRATKCKGGTPQHRTKRICMYS